MKTKKRARSSSLFLMELILAILFFSIASAVCVQFFVKSHLLCKRTQELNHAVNSCTSVAEYLSVSDSDDLTTGTHYTYYDSDFSVCEKDDASYVLRVTLTEQNHLLNAHISMNEINKKDPSTKEELIYQLHTSHHISRRTTHEAN